MPPAGALNGFWSSGHFALNWNLRLEVEPLPQGEGSLEGRCTCWPRGGLWVVEEGLGGSSRALQLCCCAIQEPGKPLWVESTVAFLKNLPGLVFTHSEGREGKLLDKRGRSLGHSSSRWRVVVVSIAPMNSPTLEGPA